MNGIKIIKNEDGSITLNGTATANFVLYYNKDNMIFEGNYTFYLIGKNNKINLQGRENGVVVAYIPYVAEQEHIVKNYEKRTISTELFSYIQAGRTFNNETFKVMITKGSEVKNYTPNKSQTYTIYTQQEFLEGDTFIKKNGKWYEKHMWKEYIVNGKKSVFYVKTSQANTAYFEISLPSACENSYNNVICNELKNMTASAQWIADEESVAINNTLRVRINKSRLSGYNEDLTSNEKVALMKEFLANNNLTVYYKTAEATYLECTAEQTTQLNELEKMQMYLPTTNIYSTDEISPNMSLKYNHLPKLPSFEESSEIKVLSNNITIVKTEENLFNINNKKTDNFSPSYSVDNEDWITLSYIDNTSGTATSYRNAFTKMEKSLKTNTNYCFVMEIKGVEGSGKIVAVSAYGNNKSQFNEAVSYNFADLTPGMVIKKQIKTLESFKDSSTQLRTYCCFDPGQAGSITFRLSLLKDTPEEFIYKPHKEQKIVFPLTQEMYKGDYLAEDGIHYTMKKIVVNGTTLPIHNSKLLSDGKSVQSAVYTTNLFTDNPTLGYSNMSSLFNYYGVLNTFVINNNGTTYIHFDKNTLIGEAELSDTAINAILQKRAEDGDPLTIIAPARQETIVPYTSEQQVVYNQLTHYYLSKGENTIFFDNELAPIAELTYVPEQNIFIDYTVQNSNLLNDSAFYYNNDIHKQEFKELDTGDATKSGITADRALYLYNAGTKEARLNLTFDLLIPAESAPLTIQIESCNLTKDGVKVINKVSEITISNFAKFKPFLEIYDNNLSNWQIEINSILCETYLKHKTDKTKIISLNKFNDKQSYLTLADCNFVDYSKPFPTSLEEVENSAIEKTIFNKISVVSTAQNYRLKNVNLDWKHTYI